MSFQAASALAVASLDLELVRLLRGAILAADIAGGKFGPLAAGGAFGPAAIIEPRRRIHPEPEIQPRRQLHPTPHFQPRPVFHPTPRLELDPASAPVEPEHPACCISPIQPPWKQRVWEIPIVVEPKLKVVQYRTDIPHKGSLLDMFM